MTSVLQFSKIYSFSDTCLPNKTVSYSKNHQFVRAYLPDCEAGVLDREPVDPLGEGGGWGVVLLTELFNVVLLPPCAALLVVLVLDDAAKL